MKPLMVCADWAERTEAEMASKDAAARLLIDIQRPPKQIRVDSTIGIQPDPTLSPKQLCRDGKFRRRSRLQHEVRSYGVLVERVISRHYSQSAGGDEVLALVLGLIVSDNSAFRQLDIAIDDGPPDTAVTADVHVRKHDARIELGVRIDAHILRQHAVANHGAGNDASGGND